MLRIERTLSLFKDVETGSRGFALTGDEGYLEPYFAATHAIPEEIARIKSGFEGRDPDQFSWAEFDVLISRRLTLARQVIDERRGAAPGALDDRPLLDEGKQTMDTLRTSFARLATDQSAFIDKMNAALAKARQRSLILAWVSAGVTVLLMTLSAYFFLSERRARQQLASDLRVANLTLEERVAERTQELAGAHRRIAGFAAEQDRSIEAERRRLSREVHDQLGPIFAAIRMALIGLPPAALPPEQEIMLDEALDMGVRTTRRIAAELRPPLLDDLGLDAAVRHFLTGLFQNSGIASTVVLADQKQLSERQAMSIFRLIQEAATNALRHADARHFTIDGALVDGAYQITIIDDGEGMDTANFRPGAQGLNNMRERAELMGGTWHLDSGPGAGMRLSLRIPMAKGEEAICP